MSISPDIRKRLLYAKYLLARARSAQAEQHELGIAVSLLLMHDAAEMLLLAVVDHLQVPMPKKWDFMDFWLEIKKAHPEPPQRIAMESMNKMRVALKHNGTLPHAQTVRDFLPRMEAFCEDVSNWYLDGLDFRSLSLADLVGNEQARTLLTEAQAAFTTGKKQEAFVKLKVAFDTLERQLPHELPLLDKLSRLPSRVPQEVRKIAEDQQKVVDRAIENVNMLMLGIDPIKYRFFSDLAPKVSWSVSGNYQVMIWKQYDNISNEVFEQCFDFVVEVSFKIGEVFRALSLLPHDETTS
jgi:hypothetical protein